ncbi:hypothetical protein FEM48_Zijuj05G0147500 [Ziziphus jujuba var. spinosa]|uniref:Glutathione S-transferase n=1 Tax=Ziziphus jujuba var. spinosa TaxID=714518 RepID=A0A0H4LUZ9_ZIZJJ|nr:glutathione S-transferase [Ziziphus jujuba var. spinosa]KAH7529093.1 hypothetical protein FEM48_Zijuj05G0147500 [Ziziphus jujuba var. spinosa]
MAAEGTLAVHGMWASPFSKRVELALKVKGIPYEYVEEDLKNKRPYFLSINPVYKKIPVLVHNGKPIAESLIILEYIEDTWKNTGPKLLPDDFYERAQVRFWVDFLHSKFSENVMAAVTKDGETREKALNGIHEQIKILDEGLKRFYPNGTSGITHENLGLLGVVGSSVLCPFLSTEEALGIQLIDPEQAPLVHSWVETLRGISLVKETLPPHDKLVQITKYFREISLNPPQKA